jgi:cytochrome c553
MRNVFLLLLVPLAASAAPPTAAVPAPTPEQVKFFESSVRPLLLAHCTECHGSKKQSGGLRLDDPTFFRLGGDNGSLLAAKHDESLFLKAVRHEGPKMPPKKRLSDAEIKIFAQWIGMGAPWPATNKVVRIPGVITAEDRAFWAFQKVQSPAPPNLAHHPIDAFLQEKHHAKGLEHLPRADRRTLIRRLTFDLTGLAPTPEEILAFEADDRHDAYERLVDRLLASPAYGERWGRHWLDVVRYADTAGDNSDFPAPLLYKYRNRVIDVFNADLPFDRFITEQLAGDLLPASNEMQRRENLISTGYLANARRFGSYEDKRYQWYLTFEDSIENLGRSFLGLSLSCSRCHDHKFDPIPAEDYYALYGFFQSTRYPWAGTELDKRPRDNVELPGGEQLYAVSEGKRWVGNAKMQLRGEPTKLGREVPRRFLTILGGQPLPKDVAGSGRLQLAQWVVSPENPLTARVLVNRLWHWHFGRGLVATPNDFGRQGQPPSHPELLDYLATTLIDKGWSLKAMHRMMLTSEAYRRSSGDHAENTLKDAENVYLWRFARKRLEAEAIRDQILSLGEILDRSVGQAHPFPASNTWGFTQHNPFKAVYDSDRRSVYLMTQRIQRHPYLALFDGPDTNAATAKRDTSTTTLQALYLLNDPLMHRAASGFAQRITREAKDDRQRITRTMQLAFGRVPSETEMAEALSFVEQARAKLSATRERTVDSAQIEKRIWESFAKGVLLSNELITID